MTTESLARARLADNRVDNPIAPPSVGVPQPRLPAANGSNVLPMRRRLTDHAERSAQAPLQLFLGRMLDEIDYGMILLDAKGCIWHVNHLARAEIGAGQVLHVEDGQLCTRAPGKNADLQQAIRRAGQGARSMIVLRSSTQPDQPACELALVPMGHPLEALGSALPVLAITSRQTLCEPISIQFFAQAHGLTTAEKNVLMALSQGLEVEEIAQKRGISEATVRTQVKQLRVKTQCGSIREILTKLSKLPPVVSSIKAF